ncbi:MAG: 3-hydroxyacyl-CoA dehydrogenase, partial [Christensenellaceae bacterium]
MGRFSGRRAWITGADTPLGAALAQALYGEGAALALSGVRRPPEGVEARCYPVNPVDDEHAARALEGFGPLDYL